jgi:thioester reductase-like protein
MGDQKVSTEAEVLANPLYPTNSETYKAYHQLMLKMEAEVISMHRTVNSLYEKQKQLETLLKTLPEDAKYNAVRKEGEALVKKMKAWDEDMVQRKSKAYDDVENFPNKFTANYMFLINQTESDIPRVNQPSLDLLKELNAEWSVLKSRSDEILNKDIPALNKMLWDVGVGAVWENE